MAARLIDFTIRTHASQVEKISVHVWTDSMIVLGWINSSQFAKQYVRQRVENIRNLIPDAIWHYVPTTDNPADLLSRGMLAEKYLNCKVWFD